MVQTGNFKSQKVVNHKTHLIDEKYLKNRNVERISSNVKINRLIFCRDNFVFSLFSLCARFVCILVRSEDSGRWFEIPKRSEIKRHRSRFRGTEWFCRSVCQAKWQFWSVDPNEMILRSRKYISNLIPSLKAIELRPNAPAISLTLLFIARSRERNFSQLY